MTAGRTEGSTAGRSEGHAEGRIAVIGAGAIGLLYAGRLARVAATPPLLVTRRVALLPALRAGITIVLPDGSQLNCPGADARLEAQVEAGSCDLALIAVAAYDTPWAARQAGLLLRPGGPAITVQNGLDNRAELAAVLGAERALQGATSFPTSSPQPAVAQLSGQGATWLPTLPADLAWLPALLERAGLVPLHVANPDELAWHKIAIGLNGFVCLALAKPLGEVVTSPAARALVLRAAHEVIDVAAAHGASLDHAAMEPALQQSWASCSPGSLSSIYADYLAGKHTELEERLGAVVRRARDRQVAAPTLESLYDMARARLELESRT